MILRAAGMEATVEVPIELSFRDFSILLAMDLVVEQKVIYELKAVAALLPNHASQLMGYLFLTNTTHGKLVNFRTQSVESKFINSTLSTAERQQFDTNWTHYRGESGLTDLIRELIGNWGTGLNAALYRRAVLHCWGSEGVPEQLLPMTSAGQRIGNQRFNLLDQSTAFGVTTFTEMTQDNVTAFRKLLAVSPLHQIHWLNITHRQVTLSTILKN